MTAPSATLRPADVKNTSPFGISIRKIKDNLKKDLERIDVHPEK